MRNYLHNLLTRWTFIRWQLCLPALFLTAIWPSAPDACSRLLWNNNGDQVIVGRNMDWFNTFKNFLFIMPRGIQVMGGTPENPMTWNVKYGNIISTISAGPSRQGPLAMVDNAADGLNEKGLAAHFLFLSGSVYENRDLSRPGVSTLRWVSYLLDNFSTVNEALVGMDKIQIVPSKFNGYTMDFHVAIEDKTGDSAIIEFIGGKKTVYHDRDFIVLTNNPSYDAQIRNLTQYRTFGGTKPLPGNIESTDRFVRLQYFSQYLPQTKDKNKAVSYMLSAMRTVASPFGAPYSGGATYPTWWTSVSDLTNAIYHYDWVESPSTIKVELSTIDFSEGSEVRWLDPRRPELSGNVNSHFQPIKKAGK
jgi:penicillin V acylase-like amidase (Ntn superfamily)